MKNPNSNYISSLVSKYKGLSIVAKASLWFVFATVLQKGVSFLTVPIFTRIMTTDQYGLYNAYLSLASILTIICGLEFQSCIYINNLSKLNDNKEKEKLAVSLINLTFIITSIWFIIYLVAKDFWNRIFGVTSSMMYLMFLEAYFVPVVNFWVTKQRFNYKYKALVIWSVLQVILNAVFGIIFVLIVDNNQQASARVFSIALVQCVFGSILIVSYCKKAGTIFYNVWWKKALLLHIPLLPHSLSLTILSSADRLMINHMIGPTETALYGVAYSASMVINLIKLSVVNALTPWIYECIKEKKYDEIEKRSRICIIIVMMMSFTFILFAPELILIVGGKKYYSAIYVVPPVAVSVFFTFLYNLFSIIQFYYEKTKEIMMASLSAAFINLILNVIFINIFGYVAAAYTTLICYILLSVAHYIFMRKTIKTHDIKSEVFDMNFILLMSIVVLASMVGFSFLYKFIIVRYCMIALLIILMILKRKVLLSALNKPRRG